MCKYNSFIYILIHSYSNNNSNRKNNTRPIQTPRPVRPQRTCSRLCHPESRPQKRLQQGLQKMDSPPDISTFPASITVGALVLWM